MSFSTHSANAVKRRSRIVMLLLALFAISLLLPIRARAVEFTTDGLITADQVIDDDVFINAQDVTVDGVVNGDLFINSETTTINGTINGNLIIASGLAIINGQVNGSLVFGGQEAQLFGPVTGSVYGAGNTFRVEDTAQITRNLYFAGYALQTAAGSQVGRDALMTGAQANFFGSIGRNISVSANTLEIHGTVGGDIQAKVEVPGENSNSFSSLLNFNPNRHSSVEPLLSGLRVFPEATIRGRLTYESPVDQAAAIQTPPEQGVIFTRQIKPTMSEPRTLAEQIQRNISRSFGNWVTLLVLGSLALWLIPQKIKAFSNHSKSWLSAIGHGLIVMFAGFAGTAALFCAVLIVGILIAIVNLRGLAFIILGAGLPGVTLFFMLFLLLFVYGSKLITSMMIGELLVARLIPTVSQRSVVAMVLGISIYSLLAIIPLVDLVATLFGLGGVWLAIRAEHPGTSQSGPAPAIQT